MQLLIDGELRSFTPVKAFRRDRNLPDTFGVALFEPKDFTGLGRVDRAGAELNSLRAAMLTLLADSRPQQTATWLKTIKVLRDFFRLQLEEINTVVGLRDVEIDYAVSGLDSMLEAVVWAVLRAQATGEVVPPFDAIYADWLNATVRVSHTIHAYRHGDARWAVQLVYNAYGRVGLLVRCEGETWYVSDSSLACPAESFMYRLAHDLAVRILPSEESTT